MNASVRPRGLSSVKLKFSPGLVGPRGVGSQVWATLAEAEADIIPEALATIWVGAYADSGDGGGSWWQREASEPTHSLKFQSTDGAWWSLLDQIVTPQKFGIDDTGATNVAAAMSALINDATTLGREVYIPDGIYDVGQDHILITVDNATIRCQSRNAIIRQSIIPNGGVELNTIGPAVWIKANYPKWRGGRITYTDTLPAVSSTHAGLYWGRKYPDTTSLYEGLDVQELRIDGRFDQGIVLFEPRRAIVANNSIQGVKNRAIYVGIGSDHGDFDIKILNNTIRGTEVGGATAYTQYGINTNDGAVPAGPSVGFSFGLLISGNNIRDITGHGVGISGGHTRVRISDNYFQVMPVGITCQVTYLGTARVIITGNQFTVIADDAIYAYSSSHISVIGNQIFGGGTAGATAGIRMMGVVQFIISSNEVESNARNGIYVDGYLGTDSVGGVIVGNNCNACLLGCYIGAGTENINLSANLFLTNTTNLTIDGGAVNVVVNGNNIT